MQRAQVQRRPAMIRRPAHGGFRQPRPKDRVLEMVLKQGRVQDQTQAEAMYLSRLAQDKTPVMVKLVNNEEIFGWIEYYDKSFIRITRDKLPNVFVYKDQIKYIAEQGRR
ncbi:MAG: DUF1581 domain-containing protein [Acidimicrobiia bacterium]|nr:DUF1581 domain-containing protein [Acidimicrobiia bacterium]